MSVLSIAASIIYLFLLGSVHIKGNMDRAGIGEKPILYTSEYIQFILNLGLIGWIIMTIVIMFINWKLLVGLLVVGFFLSGFVFVPLVERLLAFFYVSLSKWAEKKVKEKTKRK